MHIVTWVRNDFAPVTFRATLRLLDHKSVENVELFLNNFPRNSG